MSIKRCGDCNIKLTEENKTVRYNRCKECEKIRYRQVRLRKKEKLIEKFLKDPNIRRVEGFNGRYLVSNTGDVYGVNETEIKKLSPGLNKSGYHVVCLFNNGAKSMKNVHRLVAAAFIENKYPYLKKIINHKDGNKINNHVDNLEWCTHKQNVAHALKTGLQPKGEQITSAKLTEKDVLEIYQNEGRISQKELANIYDITVKVVSLIQKKKVWKHVKRSQAKPKRKFLMSSKNKEIDFLSKEITWRVPKDRSYSYAALYEGDILYLNKNENSYILYINNIKSLEFNEFPKTWKIRENE